MASILYLEDDPRAALHTEASLVNAGHVLSLASDVDQALSLCENYEFDLIIADLFIFDGRRLAAEGGYTLIRRLRSTTIEERRWWKTVPILALSSGLGSNFGVETEPDRALRQALAHGADASLPKSVAASELIATIERLLEKGDSESAAS